MTETDVRYDREVLVEVLVYHARTATSGCQCGWDELGKSHPEHVADVYEQSIVQVDSLLTECDKPETITWDTPNTRWARDEKGHLYYNTIGTWHRAYGK